MQNMQTERRPRRAWRWLAACVVTLLLATTWVAWLAGYGQTDLAPLATPAANEAEAIRRGAYLATAGNCAGCHTARGGAAMAGGRAIATPFGTVFAGNLTPDAETGLGRWTADDFWRAMHHGRSRDGRFLLPAFPYPQYTQLSRSDSDALWTWLRSLPPVSQAARPAELRFPYNTQAALAVWRALYFRPSGFQPDPAQSPAWNRGAYLVGAVGHCAACHADRNALGATQDAQALGGGLIPMQGWYAPSLAAPEEAGVAHWSEQAVIDLLKTGRTAGATVLGPMAEVVFRSTQHLNEDDLRAMASYLRALPQRPVPRARVQAAPEAVLSRGSQLYEEHCADCHGLQGQGAPGAYPPLAGNRTVGMNVPANVIRVVLAGGFAPSTAGHPRPYGMPPYAQTLSDEDIAALVSHVRQVFGAGASPVNAVDVNRLR